MIKLVIDTTVIIAAIPVVAYAMHFAYEAGFAKTLGILPSFISLRFIDVLSNVIYLSYSFIVAIIFFTFLISLDHFFYSVNKIMFCKFLLGICLVSFFFYFFNKDILKEHVDLFENKEYKKKTFYLFLLLTYIFVFVSHDKMAGLFVDINSRINHVYAYIFFSIIAMFVISYLQGLITSKIQSQYLTIDSENKKTKRVILRRYGNNLVCSDIEPDEQGEYHFVKNYIICKLTKADNVLKLEKIGPLEKSDNK